jgi:hypothetical protein
VDSVELAGRDMYIGGIVGVMRSFGVAGAVVSVVTTDDAVADADRRMSNAAEGLQANLGCGDAAIRP